MKRIWFLWAVLFAVASKGWSFDFDSYRVGLGDGLVSTDIRTMTQDDKGYIWFGSTYGLLRYDGFHVHTYLVSATGNNHLLYDNHIRDLIYWKEGLVVVRVQGQYCTLFDTRENRFCRSPSATTSAPNTIVFGLICIKPCGFSMTRDKVSLSLATRENSQQKCLSGKTLFRKASGAIIWTIRAIMSD